MRTSCAQGDAYVASPSGNAYRPRDAEHAVLYGVIDEHLDAFLETAGGRKVKASFVDRGQQRLKNIRDPVRAHAIRVSESGARRGGALRRLGRELRRRRAGIVLALLVLVALGGFPHDGVGESVDALCAATHGEYGRSKRPFDADGNKRVAHAAMVTLFPLNGRDIDAPVDEQERLMLEPAAGRVSRTELVDWLQEQFTALRAVGSARPPAAVLGVTRQRAESGLVLRLSHPSPGRRTSRSRARPAADATLLGGTAP